jgi:hypothetical protein
LVEVLRQIHGSYFTWNHTATPTVEAATDEPRLDFSAAARLWYACGLKLLHLTKKIQPPLRTYESLLSFTDFLAVFEQAAAEDEVMVTKMQESLKDDKESPCEVWLPVPSVFLVVRRCVVSNCAFSFVMLLVGG